MKFLHLDLARGLEDIKRGILNLPWTLRKLHQDLWWKLVPGKIISVPWPAGWTPADELGNSVNSADPNDWFRPWLTKNVGRQCWDWNWDLGNFDAYDGRGELLVKFRLGKTQYASMFLLTRGA